MRYIKSRTILENIENMQYMFQEIIDDFDGQIIESNDFSSGLFKVYDIEIDPKLYNEETISFIEERFSADATYKIYIEKSDVDLLTITIVNKQKLEKVRPRLEKEIGSDVNLDTLDLNFKDLDAPYLQVRWASKSNDNDSISIINLNSTRPGLEEYLTKQENRPYEYWSCDHGDPHRTDSMKKAAVNLIDFVLRH